MVDCVHCLGYALLWLQLVFAGLFYCSIWLHLLVIAGSSWSANVMNYIWKRMIFWCPCEWFLSHLGQFWWCGWICSTLAPTFFRWAILLFCLATLARHCYVKLVCKRHALHLKNNNISMSAWVIFVISGAVWGMRVDMLYFGSNFFLLGSFTVLVGHACSSLQDIAGLQTSCTIFEK